MTRDLPAFTGTLRTDSARAGVVAERQSRYLLEVPRGTRLAWGQSENLELTPKLDDESPHAIGGLDIRSLPIGPLEARVLSCVDGRSTRDEIAAVVGSTPERVAQILERLAELGAVRFGRAASASPPERRPPTATARSGAYRIEAEHESRASEPARPPSAASPAPVAGVPDVDPAWRRGLLELHACLDSKNHYELLGLEPGADEAALRASYLQVVKTFHPDCHYGKPLADLGPKLVRVFSRLTAAYEVLSRAGSRADYDRSLRLRGNTWAEPAGSGRTGVAPQQTSSIPPGAASSRSSASSLRPADANSDELEQRKRALARKLGHPSLPPAGASSPGPRSSTPSPEGSASSSRYENQSRLRNQQLDHYVGLADAAVEKQQLVSACNFLKLACSLAPQDLKLSDRLKALELRTATELWVSYAERGQQEAINGDLAAAARSYERAALGHPNGALLERVAYCLLEAKGDVKRAGEFAQRAVALAPQNVRCRLTLARCYAAAKLRANALAELEHARALAPELPEIKDWIRRIEAGEA